MMLNSQVVFYSYKMRSFFIILLLLFLGHSVVAQKLYYNVMNYQIGTKAKFQNAVPDEVEAGDSGVNVVWNFSDLKDSTTVSAKITRPDSIGEAEFPEAKFIEKQEDGTFKAFMEEQGRTYLLGYLDKEADVKLHYTKPMLISRRPISYGDKIYKDYKSSFTYKNKTYTGEGEVSIESDGAGTLILPDDIYEDVIRIKVTKEQSSFIEKYDTSVQKETVSYFWFDEERQNPLMEISASKARGHTKKEVRYLKEESGKSGLIIY